MPDYSILKKDLIAIIDRSGGHYNPYNAYCSLACVQEASQLVFIQSVKST